MSLDVMTFLNLGAKKTDTWSQQSAEETRSSVRSTAVSCYLAASAHYRQCLLDLVAHTGG